jgi:hypothetical protein
LDIFAIAQKGDTLHRNLGEGLHGFDDGHGLTITFIHASSP